MLVNSSESTPLEPPDCVGSRDFPKEDQRALSGENGHMMWKSSTWPQTVALGWVLCPPLPVSHAVPTPTCLAGPWRPHLWSRLHFWVVASDASPFRWILLFGCSTQCWNSMSPTPGCLLLHFSPCISAHQEQCLGFHLSHQACFQAFWASLCFYEGPLYVLFHFWNLLWHTLWLASTGVSE